MPHPTSWLVYRVVGAAALCLLGLVEACSSGSTGGHSSSNKLVVDTLDSRTPTFGPWSQSTHSDAMVETLLFSNLVKTGPDGHTVKPDLADSWTTAGDGKIYTFTLHHGVSWSDGKPLTAADVVFTVTKAAQLGATPYIGFQPLKWLEVQGASDIKGTTKPLAGIQAQGSDKVRITLAKPDSTFLASIASAVYAIVPQHALAAATANNVAKLPFSTTKPIGTGPYTLTKYVPDQYLQFTANSHYFRGAPKIKTIFYQPNLKDATVMTQLQSGSAQLAFNLAPEDSSELGRMSGVKSKFVTSPGAEFLQFRVDNPRVADPRVRQAFYYAIDRRNMLSKLFSNHGKVLWTLPGFNQNDAALDKYPYNKAKAKALLKAAHFDFSKPFQLLYSPDIDPLWQRMASVVQGYLKAVGVKLVLDPVDSAKWEADMTAPKPPYALTFQAGGSMGLGPDRSSVYFQCHAPVDTFFSDCAVTDQYATASATLNKSAQAAAYAKIGQVLNKQLPFATLWQTDNLYAYSSKLGGGFEIYSDWEQTFSNIQDWTMG